MNDSYTLTDLPEDYQARLPRLNKKDVRIRSIHDWWDGPLQGIAVYDEKPCWYERRYEDDNPRQQSDGEGRTWDEWYAEYILVELTPEQHQEQIYREKLFREKVGTHFDCDEAGNRLGGNTMPKENWHEFYDVIIQRGTPDLSQNTVIGWFDWLRTNDEE